METESRHDGDIKASHLGGALAAFGIAPVRPVEVEGIVASDLAGRGPGLVEPGFFGE